MSITACRGMVDQFCHERERIGHSALYRAGHSLGQLLISNESAYGVAKEYLMGFDVPMGDSWPPMKFKYEHTRTREDSLRDFLQLVCILMLASEFAAAFFRYLKQVHLFFSRVDPILPPLYVKGKEKPNDTS